MTKPIGPTVPRWKLGSQLSDLRHAGGKQPEEVAKTLECSASKIRKVEAGYVSISRGDLILMLDMYGVSGKEQEPYLELASLGRGRGWWSKFGKLSTPFTNLLGLESAASRINVFESQVVYGLFQTDEYAEALIRATLQADAPEVDRQMTIRHQRQQHVLDTDPPEIWLILDEAVLHRVIGSTDVTTAQLKHLIQLERDGLATIQILPFTADPHPGTLGPFTVFEFPDNLHSPIGYVESQAGSLYMEEEPDFTRCRLNFQRICAAANGPAESITKVRKAVQSLSLRKK